MATYTSYGERMAIKKRIKTRMNEISLSEGGLSDTRISIWSDEYNAIHEEIAELRAALRELKPDHKLLEGE